MLSLYFSVVGVITLTSSFSSVFALVLTSTQKYGFKTTLPFIGKIDMELTPAEYICGLCSCVFAYYYFVTKHFMMNNILGISFCIQSLEKISIGSYKIGAILLIGLFFYDIFWVFGTEVMVKVAKSFDGPIKLLFPRILPYINAEGILQKGEFSLLGLGDIVVPGFFLSLMLRFDCTQAKVPFNTSVVTADFPKPYFYVTLFSYALGLGLTVGVMYFFNAAQPALLYLVPCCLIASLGTGYFRGELTQLFAYNEETEEGKEETEDADNKKDK